MTRFGVLPWLGNPKFAPAPKKPIKDTGNGWPIDFMAALAAAEQRGYERGLNEARRVASVECALAESTAPPTMLEIAQDVAAAYGLRHWTALRNHLRRHDICRPRQEAMARCAKETGQNLQAIGRFFGGFDHTTVMHAIRAVEKREAKAAAEEAVKNHPA
jgi:chromosomal replication initiation ATPase DnaA